MAATIPNLWPEDINLDVLPPLVVLRAQAGLLIRVTKGLLQADVTTVFSEQGAVQHQLDLIAPALGYYQHRLLTARHDQNMLYPVTVDAECFRSDKIASSFDYEPPQASTQQEFLELVGKVLRSSEVRAVMQSLIARSNEVKGIPPAPDGEGEAKSNG